MLRTTQCVIFDGAGLPMRLERVPTPQPREGEVLVRVTCCTVCGSDLHTYHGRRKTPTPTVLGHEIIGRVEATGGPVIDLTGRTLRAGDRVTWSVAASCGGCFFCNHELPQKCESLFKYGHEKITPAHALSGGLAERCLLAPGTAIMVLPDDLPDRVACPANCATATVAAVLRTGGLKKGQSVVVLGLGMLGLTAAAMARSLGASVVVGCDVDADRIETAKRFGVTRAVDAADAAGVRAVMDEMTAGRGADLVVELSGSARAVEQGIGLLRIGGQLVLAGSVSPGRDVAINPETVVRRMLRVAGVHNYTPADLKSAVEFLTRHHRDYPFENLIGGEWPLSEAEEAFAEAVAKRMLRVAVIP